MPPQNDPKPDEPAEDASVAPAPAVDARRPPEANDTTGIRSSDYEAEFADGTADVTVGEFVASIADVWAVDQNGDPVPVDGYNAAEAGQGATKVTVRSGKLSGRQTVRVYITA